MVSRKSLIVIIFLVILISTWILVHFQSVIIPLSSISVKILKNDDYVYGHIELGVIFPNHMLREIEDPFDRNSIQVTGYFSLNNQITQVYGFFYQNYTRHVVTYYSGPLEWLEPEGDPFFLIRFTPINLGTYECFVEVTKDSTLLYKSQKYIFPVTTIGKRKGFIQVDNSSSKPVFRFKSGELYRPIGLNYCWPNGKEGSYTYDYYFNKSNTYGIDYTRIWLAEWSFALEWSEASWPYPWPSKNIWPLGFGGIGKYNLQSAWRLDYIFQIAEEKGIYILLTINTFGQFNTGISWAENPYNSENGGILENPVDFFIDSRAIEAMKNQYRYLITRYSPFSSLFAWEIFNDIDLVDGFNEATAYNWQSEMLAFFTVNDPYNHLKTSSYSDPYKGYELWMNENTSFVNFKYYNNSDILTTLESLMKIHQFSNTKPILLTEFGLNSTGEGRTEQTDTKGIFIHKALWSSLFLGFAGVPASWWWDFYFEVIPAGYNQYTPFKNFLGMLSSDLLPLGEPMNYTINSSDSNFSNDSIHVFNLINEENTEGALWLPRTEYIWWKENPTEGLSFNITVYSPQFHNQDRWSVTFINTTEGDLVRQILSQEIYTVINNTLTFEVQRLFTDIAVLFQR